MAFFIKKSIDSFYPFIFLLMFIGINNTVAQNALLLRNDLLQRSKLEDHKLQFTLNNRNNLSETTSVIDNYYSSSGDGNVWNFGSDYNTVRSSTSGTPSYTGQGSIVGQEYGDQYYIWGRTFLPFNTSALPDNATILSAKLFLYGMADHSDNDFDIAVVQTTQSSVNVLESNDYSQCGDLDSTAIGGMLNSQMWTSLGYNEINFNSDWIDPTGWTKIGLRSYSEIQAWAPSSMTEEWISFYTSESSYPPYIEVTYSIPISLNILAPNGNELLAGGSNYTIQWTATNTDQFDHYLLAYTTDGGSNYTVITNYILPTTATSYEWTVPNINSTNVKILIQALSADNNTIFAEDESDAVFTIDSSPPGPFNLVSPANGTWTDATPYFVWDDSDGADYYQIWIDGILTEDNIIVTNDYATNPLSTGWHTWTVKAIDNAGNVTQANNTWSIQVDLNPPDAFNLINPEHDTWTNDPYTEFSWEPSNDIESGLDKYMIYMDDILKYVDYYPENGVTYTYGDMIGFSEGTHKWFVKAVDNVDNETSSDETRIINLDTTPPESNAPGNSLYFDGDEDYVEVPHNDIFNPSSQITIEAWIKFETGGLQNPTIVSKNYSSTNWGYKLSTQGTGNSRQVRFGFRGLWIGSSTNIDAGIWHHIAATYSGYSARLYIDGIQKAFANISGSISPGTGPLTIGIGRNNLGDFKGEIDEVRIWNVARTQAEILADMDNIISPTETGLIGYWRFDEGTGSQVADLTIFQNHGNLIGNTSFTINPNLSEESFALVSPENDYWTSNSTPTFVWNTAVDTGIGNSHYQLWIDDSLYVDNIPFTDTTYTLLAGSELSNGGHSWFIKAFDLLGNNSISNKVYTLNIDLEPPNSFSLLSPDDSAYVTFPTPNFSWYQSWDNGSGLSHFQLWIDSTLNVDNISGYVSSPSSPLTEGPHTWFVRAIDNVGNIQTTETRIVFGEWSSPLSFDLVSPEDGDTVQTSSPVFSWHPSADAGTGLLKYQLWIGNSLNRDNIPPVDTSTTPPIPLENDTYNWYVKALDFAGNTTSSNSIWSIIVDVDYVPPVSQITYPSDGDTIEGVSLVVQGTSNDGSGIGVDSVFLSTDNGLSWNFAQKVNNSYDQWIFNWDNLNYGDYTIWCRAKDLANNMEIPGDSVKIHIRNLLPYIVNPLPDLFLHEDALDTALISLDSVFSDLNVGDTLLYTDEVIPPDIGVSVFIDEDNNIPTIHLEENWNGNAQVVFTASDNQLDVIRDTLEINVTAINDTPIVSDIPDAEFNEDEVFSFDLDYYVSDVDDSLSWLSWSVEPVSGQSVINFSVQKYGQFSNDKWQKTDDNINSFGTIQTLFTRFRIIQSEAINLGKNALNRSITNIDTIIITIDSLTHIVDVSATLNYNISDIPFRFIAMDTSGATDDDTMLVTVLPINDPPILSNIPDTILNEDNTLATGISWWNSYVTDVDNQDDELIWSFIGNQNITINQIDTTIIFTPVSNWYGYENITAIVSDGQLSDSSVFQIMVNSVNDPPVVVDIPDTIIFENRTISISLSDYVSDADLPNDNITWSYSGGDSLLVSINNDTAIIGHLSGWTGIDSILFVATDDSLASDSDWIRIVIIPIPRPTNLIATSGLAYSIPLIWNTPAYTPDEPEPQIEEIIFDDGSPSNAYTWGNGAKMASRLTPSWPCRILEIKFYHNTPGLFQPGIFSWTGSQPGSVLLEFNYTSSSQGWVTIDVSSYDIQVTGDFVVSNGLLNSTVALGYDPVNNGRAWDWNGTSWSSWNETYFIRAVVQELTTGRIAAIGYGMNKFNNDINNMIEVLFEKRSHKLAKIPEIGQIAKTHISNDYSDNSIVHRVISRDILSHYNVYRSEVLGESYTQIATNVLDTTFNDVSVELGTMYLYVVTAVYSDPQQESDYSNETSATTAFPPVIGILPDTSFNEDENLVVIISSWFPFVDDGDTPDEDLTWLLTGSDNLFVNQSDSGFIFTSALDWHGQEPITLIVSDGQLMDTTVFTISVLSVPDDPIVIDPLSDITFNEDQIDSSINLNTVFYDGDGDSLVFNFTGNESIDISIINSIVYLHPDSNWYGSNQVVFTAFDGISHVSDSVLITVLPVNDYPQIFNLLMPNDSTIVEITNNNLNDSLLISWEESIDVDGDTVMYIFIPSGELSIFDISDTTVTELQLKYAEIFEIMQANAMTSITGTWTIHASDGNLVTEAENGPFTLSIDATTVRIVGELILPTEFALHQNYPNPFNPITTIRYDLPEQIEISIVIYDIMGRQIKILINEIQEPGYKLVEWDATNIDGQPVGSGLYFYQIKTGNFIQTNKMVLIK